VSAKEDPRAARAGILLRIASLRKLVAKLPTPRRDHRENELSALLQQPLVNVRVVLADRLGNMGEIELGGSTTGR